MLLFEAGGDGVEEEEECKEAAEGGHEIESGRSTLR